MVGLPLSPGGFIPRGGVRRIRTRLSQVKEAAAYVMQRPRRSAKCHCQFDRARIRRIRQRRISEVNVGPNLFHQKRMGSWLTSIPRSWSKSSAFPSDSGNRTYIITAMWMISGLVLRYLKGARFFMRAGKGKGQPASSCVALTLPRNGLRLIMTISNVPISTGSSRLT